MTSEDFSYEHWTQLLGSFFFDPCHKGDEILFAVDDLALSEISGLPDSEATVSLAHAVRCVIKTAWDVRQVKFRVHRWRFGREAGDHPALPFLALTVLAASRMNADGEIAASNFYVPLRKTLNPKDSGRGNPGSYVDCISELWSDLANWANEDLCGQRGRLILRDAGPQYGRGAAIQHALVRSSDLSQLDAFFRRIGLQPGEGATGTELLRALRVWTEQRQEAWAKRLNRLCSDNELSGYAIALLERESARWDGRPRDRRTGRAVGQIRLGVRRLRNPELGFYIRADTRLPSELTISVPDSESTVIVQSGDWYEPHPLKQPDIGKVLTDGLSVTAGSYRFEFRPEDAYPLTYDDELGLWISVDSISYGDRYHVLVRRHLASEVHDWMSEVSAIPPRGDLMSVSELPTGWVLIQNLQLERRPSRNAPPCLAGAIPTGSGPRLRLVGGLPLSAGYAVFLRGGEPGLALSSFVPDSKVTITQQATGESETINVGSNRDAEIPLWKFQLEPGAYRVQHGETFVAFQIVDGIAEQAGPNAGSIQLMAGSREGVVGTAPVTPKEVALPRTVAAPRAGLIVLLLGSCSSNIVTMKSPIWFTSLVGPLAWRQLDLWEDFQPVWQITKTDSQRFVATALTNSEPAGECDVSSYWARVIKVASLTDEADDMTRELWARYQAVAGVTQ